MDPKKGTSETHDAGLTRRAVVETTLLGAALAWVPGRLGAGAEPPPGTVHPDPPTFELGEATLTQLQGAMTAGKYTAVELATRYLRRIGEVDASGPGLRSVLEINPDALAIAEQLDRERKDKGARGPLHGIPLLIKDNIDTADRMTTSAGSLALEGSISRRDAAVAARLRAAGAVLLGKTNLSEWANFRSTHSASGWSGRGGQTRNPYALDRSPSGSSSGTAAAVAANLCAAGIGTETDGSIVSPSSVCSLVGLKPTVGLISRAGIIPIAASQDTAGPMTRTVTDAAMLLAALAGTDEADSATRAIRRRSFADYTQFLQHKGLHGARIGVARAHFFGANALVDKTIEQALAAMRSEGAILVDPADLATAGKFDDSELEVLLYEFKDGLNRYLAALGPQARVHALKDLIAFNEASREREMPYFGQELFIQAEAKGPLTDKKYRDALARDLRLSRQQGIDATLAKHKLDALVAPTGGLPWLIDWVNGDAYTGGSSTPAAVAGYPSITVPAGFARGLPVGISFIGPAWSEPKLLSLAYAFEQATQARRPPQFRATADLS